MIQNCLHYSWLERHRNYFILPLRFFIEFIFFRDTEGELYFYLSYIHNFCYQLYFSGVWIKWHLHATINLHISITTGLGGIVSVFFFLNIHYFRSFELTFSNISLGRMFLCSSFSHVNYFLLWNHTGCLLPIFCFQVEYWFWACCIICLLIFNVNF